MPTPPATPTAAAAAENFWKLVTGTRSFVIGGNSFKEWFDQPNVEAGPSIHDGKVLPYNTAETCNTHNMLKLTRQPLRAAPPAGAMPTISSAHFTTTSSPPIAPDTGRMTYFHPLHGDFKIYLPGHRMLRRQRHRKHRPLRRRHLFQETGPALGQPLHSVPARLAGTGHRPAAGRQRALRKHRQDSNPQSPTTDHLHPGLRIPHWLAGPPQISLNGQPLAAPKPAAGYLEVSRIWQPGDTITLTLPAALRIERAKDLPEMAAIAYGPLILAAKLGRTGMPNDFAEKDQYKDLPSAPVPAIVTAAPGPGHWLTLADPATLTFLAHDCGPADGLRFQPVHAVHHERFAVYLPLLTPEQFAKFPNNGERTATILPTDPAVIDQVQPGVPASENSHDPASEKSTTGTGPQNRPWRDAAPDGWFSYVLAIAPTRPLELVCTYWGGDKDREFEVIVNGRKLATQKLDGGKPGTYFEASHPLPEECLSGQQNLNVRFQGTGRGRTGGVFGLRVRKRSDAQ